MKRPNTNLAILGLIMVFSVPVLCASLGTVIDLNLYYLLPVVAPVVVILGIAGYVIIGIFYSWILSVGVCLLAFGITRVMEVTYPNPSSHSIMRGFLYICIGILLILAWLLKEMEKKWSTKNA